MYFFFNDTATTEIYTLSLHDALPISINTVLGLVNRQEILEEHFVEKEDGIFLSPEGIEIFSRAMRERILEIHHYVELDKNRYTFLYAADQQIKSLIRSFEALDPAEYVSSYTGGGKDGLL